MYSLPGIPCIEAAPCKESHPKLEKELLESWWQGGIVPLLIDLQGNELVVLCHRGLCQPLPQSVCEAATVGSRSLDPPPVRTRGVGARNPTQSYAEQGVVLF